MKIKIAFFLILLSSNSFASTAGFTVQASQFNSSLTLDLNYSPKGKEEDKPSPWTTTISVGSSTSKVLASESGTGTEVSDQTNRLQTNFDYLFSSNSNLAAGVNFSNSKINKIVGVEPHVTAGQEFFFGDGEDFRPSLQVTWKGAVNSMTQQELARRTLVRLQLQQTSNRFEIAVTPIEPLSLNAAYTSYNYNRDIPAYFAQLDSPFVVDRFGGGMGDLVSGVPSSDWSIGLTWRFLKIHSLAANYTNTTSALDSSHSYDSSLRFDSEFSAKWGYGVGLGQSQTPTSFGRYLVLSGNYRF